MEEAPREKLKELNWTHVDKIMAMKKWSITWRKRYKRIYKREDEKLVTFRTKYGKWETDYILEKRLKRRSISKDEDDAKVRTVEIGSAKQ